jgi:hypothetical protein
MLEAVRLAGALVDELAAGGLTGGVVVAGRPAGLLVRLARIRVAGDVEADGIRAGSTVGGVVVAGRTAGMMAGTKAGWLVAVGGSTVVVAGLMVTGVMVVVARITAATVVTARNTGTGSV